ncbi:MAG: S9 family peptidase [Xanthomonadales bacterium]|nr:S9 family peptidase [Xanthomonadales bacterium]
MPNRSPLTLVALLALGILPAATAAAGPPERLTLERLFSGPDLAGASLRSARFSPDGKLVTYLQGSAESKDRLDLWAHDIATGRNALLVDSRSLVADEGTLSPEEEARRERQRTVALAGIVDYQFSADSRLLLIPIAGDLFLYDLKAPRAGPAVRRLTSTAAAETDARFSPRGRFVSFVREQNLYVIEVATGRETAVTREGAGLVSFGMAEFIAQEEMDRDTGYWWSPDERMIALTRVDESTVDEVERFEIYAETVRVIRQRYPAAGRPNARVDLWVATLAGAATSLRELPAAAASEGYLARVAWFPDSRALAVQRQTRDQKRLELLKVDTASGAARRLLEERSDTWVELHDELTFLKGQPAFLWASYRSGHKHLYLYDLDGKLLRPVTAGEWMVVGDSRERAIEGVDEAKGLVYFTANRDTPIERHLYAAPLTGSSDTAGIEARIRRLTEGAGWHSVSMAGDAQRWLDTFSTPDTPPSLTLRHTTSKRPSVLVANTLGASHPYAPYLAAHRTPEFGTLRAADGQVMHFTMLKPLGFDPSKRYPVIVEVYGGPGVQRVQRAWGGYYRQYLAQQGFVVFMLDNRGSGNRGRAFETALYHRMGSIEIEDQVKGVDYLRSLTFVDPARIGVWGWSYGGYMALMAMVRAPEHFAVGVSGAPVTDWRLYDTHYTERYMGVPEAGSPESNPEGYRDGNVMTHAAALKGPLLVMHGMADDNVLFTHSTALFKRLQDLGKPFEVMPYPGSKHALLRFPNTGLHGYRTIRDFFVRTLRPEPPDASAAPEAPR